MNNAIRNCAQALLLGVLLACLPAAATAQTNQISTNAVKAATGKAPAKKKEKKPAKDAAGKKAVAGPFHGNLAAMDNRAKTITVGTRTFQITADTLIFKDGQPSTLTNGVVGGPVSGYVKPDGAGKLTATKVTFGAKADAKKEGKKADKAADKPVAKEADAVK
jgi:hypothetical protein